jgi:hypothetical protein
MKRTCLIPDIYYRYSSEAIDNYLHVLCKGTLTLTVIFHHDDTGAKVWTNVTY